MEKILDTMFAAGVNRQVTAYLEAGGDPAEIAEFLREIADEVCAPTVEPVVICVHLEEDGGWHGCVEVRDAPNSQSACFVLDSAATVEELLVELASGVAAARDVAWPSPAAEKSLEISRIFRDGAKGKLPADWRRVSCYGWDEGKIGRLHPVLAEIDGEVDWDADGYDSDGWPVRDGGIVMYEPYEAAGWDADLDGPPPVCRPVVIPEEVVQRLGLDDYIDYEDYTESEGESC